VISSLRGTGADDRILGTVVARERRRGDRQQRAIERVSAFVSAAAIGGMPVVPGRVGQSAGEMLRRVASPGVELEEADRGGWRVLVVERARRPKDPGGIDGYGVACEPVGEPAVDALERGDPDRLAQEPVRVQMSWGAAGDDDRG